MSEGSRQLEFPFSESPGEALQKELTRQLESIGITGPEASVLLFIWKHGRYRDNKSVVRASMERMAFAMDCSIGAIHKGIGRLKETGLIQSLEDEKPFAYQADWGIIRTFAEQETEADLHHKFAARDPVHGDIHGSFTPPSRSPSRSVHGHVHGAFMIGRTARASGSSFEAFSEAESEKEGMKERKNNSSFFHSFQSLNPEIFGALESRGVQTLPEQVWECPDSMLVHEVSLHLQSLGLIGDRALPLAGWESLIGSILAVRDPRVQRPKPILNRSAYALSCLRRGVAEIYLSAARKLIEQKTKRSCVS